MSAGNTLIEAMAQCREDEVRACIQQMLAAGTPANEVLAECNRGMVELGNRFQRGECYIPELMFGGMMMKAVMADLAPRLKSDQPARTLGTVVMGSVQHDVHDIGKDIVIMMLRGVGFQAVDLGVDVPPERFVAAIREHRPLVVGMSVLLTTCFRSVVNTVEAIRKADLRGTTKLMVGGAAASELLRENAGCDYYGKTAIDGVDFACQTAGVKV
jgi:5-methyltetrahydrofolate--homocysteine methyltransferase